MCMQTNNTSTILMQTRRGRRAPTMTAEGAALLSPLVELPADVQRRVAVAVADAVHPQHLCHLAGTCAALRAALAESLAALRGEHQDIEALCIQCGTTLEVLLRNPPTSLNWTCERLTHQHAAALGSLIGSRAMVQLKVSWRPTALLACLETWRTRLPDPDVWFGVPYTGALA